ncbi:MAG: argininosuccinate lyase [Christensenellales bacterium]|jgi:argininosuccinate lyase
MAEKAENKKLWFGRLAGDVDGRLNELNSSISFDKRMFKQDILGSVAHARMLGETGIIPREESKAIVSGLEGILTDIMNGSLEIDMSAEDIHTFVEQALTQRIGTAGKRLHTARSRNDQVALDIRMYLAERMDEISSAAGEAVSALCDVSQMHLETVMPGYTHLQRGQPVTLAHHLMAYAWMFLRDIERLADCKKRTLTMPLGSGALAGTTYPIDRQSVCDKLGFNGVTQNSMDAVSDRDFVIELCSCLSILAMHMSRLAEDIILWCSLEFRFMGLSDGFSTGSSIMPQKKNPDGAELIRGKAARVFGSNVTLLTMMKGLPMTYNKDMQEDKEAIFDAVDTALICLDVLAPMLREASFYPQNMAKAAAEGFINATDCADYLVKKGMAFRDAYAITGALVNLCIEKGLTLETLPMGEYKKASPLFEEDIFAAISLMECVRQRGVQGGPAPEMVAEQIKQARKNLEDMKK